MPRDCPERVTKSKVSLVVSMTQTVFDGAVWVGSVHRSALIIE